MNWIEIEVSLSDEDVRAVEKLLDKRGKVGKKALLYVSVKEVTKSLLKVGSIAQGLKKVG